MFAGTFEVGVSPLQSFVDIAAGKPPGVGPSCRCIMSMTESGKTHRLSGLRLAARSALGDHHQRHVADHFGGGRDFDDIAEHLVHVGIGLRHLVPAVFKPE